jgi:hypothetical protein
MLSLAGEVIERNGAFGSAPPIDKSGTFPVHNSSGT